MGPRETRTRKNLVYSQNYLNFRIWAQCWVHGEQLNLYIAGSSGRNPQNIKREIKIRFMKNKIDDVIVRLEIGSHAAKFAIPPHLLFARLYEKFSDKFRRHLGADLTRLRAWWEQYKETPEGKEFFNVVRPELQGLSLDDLQWWIPLSIHLDAGPISKTQSAEIATWGPAASFSEGSDFERRFLFGTWLKTPHDESENKLWDILLESERCLESGTFEDGTRLAGGWKACFIEGKMDLEEACAQLGFQSYSSEEPCGYCGANRSNMPWNHFSSRAAFVRTIYSTPRFLNKYRLSGKQHPFWLMRNMHKDFLKIDLLHTCDCKGLTSMVIGNCLFEAVYFREVPNTVVHADSIAALNDDLDRFYQGARADSMIPELQLGHFINEQTPLQNYPILKGPGIKAANTRNLVPWVRQLMEKLDTGESEHKKIRRKLVQLLDEFYEIVYGHGEYLPDDVAKHLQFVMLGILRRCVLLHHRAVLSGRMAWQLVPKHHYFFHLALQVGAGGRNPRFFQTYIDESFVGRICGVYESCQDGPYHDMIQKDVMQKYLLALCINLSRD